jgi:transcriptional regulator with XRE-family HTH domain
MNVNYGMMDNMDCGVIIQPMVDDVKETFATRFLRLKEATGLSYERLSDAVFDATGVRISGQAMHKWAQGGNIEESQLETLAAYFKRTPAWFRYGIGPEISEEQIELSRAITELPEQSRQQTLDFLKYQIERAQPLFSKQQTSHYLKMIDSIIKDMDGKKKQDQ